MKVKITDPKGICLNGVLKRKGAQIDIPPKAAQTQAWLHFKQVAPVKGQPDKK